MGSIRASAATCEQGWMGADAKAVLVQNDRGLVVLYGALIPAVQGIRPRPRLSREARLAPRPDRHLPAGTSTLHLENYAKGTRDNAPWHQGKAPPPEVLKTTDYLRLVAEVTEAERAGDTSG